MIDINYYRTISNSLNCSQQDADLYEAQNALMYDFDSNPSCKTVLLNDEEINVITYIDTDIVTGGKSYKIRCKPNQVIKIGDILNIDDEIWFVTKVDIDKSISYAGTLAKATCILKFYKDGVYRELPCYITTGTRNYINSKDNTYFSVPTSLYTGYCPDIGYLNKHDANLRVVIRNYVYQMVGVDNLTVLDNEVRNGLIIIKFKDDAVCDDDNLELGIANYWSNQEKLKDNYSKKVNQYTISINLNKDYFLCGEKVKILTTVKDSNGNYITGNNAFVNFYISDENNNEIKYANVLETTGTSIVLKVSKDGKYIGKKIKVKIIFPQLNNIVFEKIFTINSII